ncbi:hypothetical protein [Sulfuricurvum sp.]|uniref:hypothetical protein n=1 Tax=Sulfuricurvum sp. TaxID=2025608 RepID=UPI002D242042|nr:hypothetical protein [Sulfuricurvum sp.]HZF69377.1 hypothetical protein [Sulfuricurvum sp.]
MGENDFFELPVGDQHHRECIEIEYSDDYRKGYEEGVESFRPKFEAFKESLQDYYDGQLKTFLQGRSCAGCRWEVIPANDLKTIPIDCLNCQRHYMDLFEMKGS